MCQCIAPTDAITERLFSATIQTLELYGVYLGRTLGLYRALHREGPLNARALAAAAGIAERYAREWLEQQAVAGFLVVDRDDEKPEERAFRLPQEYVGVLVEEDDAAHVAPFAHMVVGIAGVLPQVAQAYRRGTGVDYHDYGPDFRHGQSGINRPAFLHDLTDQWLPAIPDLHERLRGSRDVRIADVGCGAGWSAIALARAYPEAEVIGYDLDEASIADARRHAQEKGADVRFVCKDASAMVNDGPFDLVLLLETLHDMSRPREVLTALRLALAPVGSILIADERVAEQLRRARQRARTNDVWLEHQPLSARGHGRAAVGCNRHCHPARDRAPAREGSRFRDLRNPADRKSALPFLPPAQLLRALAALTVATLFPSP